MKNLNEEIKAAIDKSLPAEVGDRLKQRLSQACDTELELKGTRKLLEEKRNEVGALTKIVNQVGSLNKRENDLRNREVEVEQKQLRIELVEAKAKAAEDKADAIHRLVSTVFSNRRIVHEVRRSQPGQPDEYGNRPIEYSEETHTTHEE